MKKYLLSIKKFIILSIVMSMLEALITSVILLIPGWLIDNYTKGIHFILRLIIFYFIAFTVYLFISYFSNRISDYRRINFEKEIKTDFFNAVISKNYNQYHKYDIEEYVSMQANDIGEMCQNYLSPLLSIFRSVLLIVSFGISLIIFVNYYIALLIILFSIAVVFVPRLTSNKLSEKNKTYLNQVGRYTSSIHKMLEAHDIFDINCKKKIKGIHNRELEKVLSLNMNFRKTNSLAMVLNGGAVEFVSVITFVLVAILLVNDKITVGMATIAFTYSTRFMEPIYELNLCIGKMQSVKKIQDKLLHIIFNKYDYEIFKNKRIDIIHTTPMTRIYGAKKLQLPETKFEYPSKYLITGENGVGKSVLLRLLLNFEKPDEGKVAYDGECREDVLEHICFVPQNTVIFNASYEDNVTIFHSYEDCFLDKYESFFPKEILDNIKKNTHLSNLSGGEKQVIAIIRALCSGKQIIIMDEPFSAMNQVTIDSFMRHIKRLDRMIIVVAHNVEKYSNLFDDILTISR